MNEFGKEISIQIPRDLLKDLEIAVTVLRDKKQGELQKLIAEVSIRKQEAEQFSLLTRLIQGYLGNDRLPPILTDGEMADMIKHFSEHLWAAKPNSLGSVSMGMTLRCLETILDTVQDNPEELTWLIDVDSLDPVLKPTNDTLTNTPKQSQVIED